MIPIHSSTLSPMGASGILSEGLGMPETGEFDFMNYMLGLQGSPQLDNQDDSLANGLMATKGQKSVDEGDKALLQLFDNKKADPTQLSLAGLIQPGQMQSLQVVSSDPNLMSSSAMLGDKAMATEARSSQSLETSHPLEDPTQKLGFDAALKDSNNQEVKPEKELSAPQKGKALHSYAQAMKPDAKGMEARVEAKRQNMELLTPEVQSGMSQRAEALDQASESVDSIKESRKRDLANDVQTTTMDSPSPLAVPLNNIIAEGKAAGGKHTVPELFSKVESMVHNGGGRMTVTLSPPELGTVEIKVTTKGKQVEIEVKSDNDFAKSALEGSVADLRQSLEGQDLTLQKMDVQVNRDMDKPFFDQSQQQSNPGFFQQQSRENRETGQRESHLTKASGNQARSISSVSNMQTIAAMNSARNTMSGSGRVDIRI